MAYLEENCIRHKIIDFGANKIFRLYYSRRLQCLKNMVKSGLYSFSNTNGEMSEYNASWLEENSTIQDSANYTLPSGMYIQLYVLYIYVYLYKCVIFKIILSILFHIEFIGSNIRTIIRNILLLGLDCFFTCSLFEKWDTCFF